METQDLISILPEIILTVIAASVLMVDAFGGQRTHRSLMGLVVGGSVIAILVSVVARVDATSAFGGMVLTDGFAVFFKVLFIAIAALSIVLAFARRTYRLRNCRRSFYLQLSACCCSGPQVT